MTLRSVVLAILSLLALIFLILNWQGITAPVPVNLIVEEIQAPLGLILLIIIVSFIPLFFLSGMEGRMLVPLGISFIV